MEYSISSEKGYTEVILNPNCDWDVFHQIIAVLESRFGISFTEKIHDFDSAYWSFLYQGSILTLHYNIFFGVSVFPGAFREASAVDNENTLILGKLLAAI
jgi:hypothetical protein